MRGILLLLLFTHQAWAEIICYCAHETQPQHVCCQTAHTQHATGKEAGAHSSDSCPNEREPSSVNQQNTAPQSEEGCCYLSPQTEARTVEISLLGPAPAEEVLPVFDITGLKTSSTECIRVLKPRLSRPLYLTHSALLI